ncbi:hypothetical protein EJB05_01216, partial [Eragrostis curvula]
MDFGAMGNEMQKWHGLPRHGGMLKCHDFHSDAAPTSKCHSTLPSDEIEKLPAKEGRRTVPAHYGKVSCSNHSIQYLNF